MPSTTLVYVSDPPLWAELLTNFLSQYLSVYMSKAAPAANSNQAGTAQTWFKVYEQAPTYANGQLTFPSTCTSRILEPAHTF